MTGRAWINVSLGDDVQGAQRQVLLPTKTDPGTVVLGIHARDGASVSPTKTSRLETAETNDSGPIPSEPGPKYLAGRRQKDGPGGGGGRVMGCPPAHGRTGDR